MGASVEFAWNPQEFQFLLQACSHDDAVKLTLRYLPEKDMQILEAGCGSGRVVKYLADVGYRYVHGIELNAGAVAQMNTLYPELRIIQGNIMDMPYGQGTFDLVASYGVVEHFPEGIVPPLRKLSDVLKPGGIAIVTVPSLNGLRRFAAALHLEMLSPRVLAQALRSLFVSTKRPLRPIYYIYPKFGDFFEYRLTPEEFETVCREAGFEVVESIPIAHVDGLFHSFGRLLVTFKNWHFQVNKLGVYVNRCLMAHPFLHNHMHACVLRKPADATERTDG